MKRVLLLLLIVGFSVFCMAQNKKVAVWETKCSDKSITSFQSTMVRGGMEAAVANAPGYIGYDRASFDAIMKEHNFQRSGTVKDSDIKRLGEMAGVQYIIVPEANTDGDDFYIIVKMLDVETGEFGAALDVLCGSSASEIKQACSELGSKLFGGYGIANGHQYVDLNLPSGTLWATCNIGANNPEDIGEYYAWGEVRTKSNYCEYYYKYSKSDKLTKYCSRQDKGENGFIDNLTSLQRGDDVAYINWGNGWHIPTSKQWEELIQNTTNKWSTQNGVNGWLFTASNGKSLFLPASGQWAYEHTSSVGNGAFYYSNSLFIRDPEAACSIMFSEKEGCRVYRIFRFFGLNIRAVFEE